MQGVVVCVIAIFFDTEGDVFSFGDFPIYGYFQFTGIQVGLTISVGPPQFRRVDHQLRIIPFVELHFRSRPRINVYFSSELHITGGDRTVHHNFRWFVRTVFHFQCHRQISACAAG